MIPHDRQVNHTSKIPSILAIAFVTKIFGAVKPKPNKETHLVSGRES